ncbi:hypothetical protein [Halosimplex sp. TS25]|uniref:hypothetical protein n=1 Tax=Halosimplex rarum TaxID=3396619 RepID=UPI0039EA463F
MEREYDTLQKIAEEDPDIHESALIHYIAPRIDLDPERTQRRQLWDIDVKIRRDIATETYPELEEYTDTGLYPLDFPVNYNKNGFEYEDHFLIFPEGLSYNYHLTQSLFDKWDGSFDMSLAFDYDKLGMSDKAHPSFLAEHWWGPDDLDAVQDSRQRNQLVTFGTGSYGPGVIDRTEFLFTQRDDEWILQIEELLPRRGVMHEFGTQLREKSFDYYTRYLHAITDEELTECFHLDGALRSYPSKESFLKRHQDNDKRLGSDWAGDTTERFKLFKLDASESAVPDYQEIIGLFFKYNPHVIEFFQGEGQITRELEEWRTQMFQIEIDDSI